MPLRFALGDKVIVRRPGRKLKQGTLVDWPDTVTALWKVRVDKRIVWVEDDFLFAEGTTDFGD